MRRALAVLTLLVLATGGPALALGEADTGTFVAVGDDGALLDRTLRVSREGDRWRFEDRTADGDWQDVSCHGGCEHRVSQVPDLVEFFGALPPLNMMPDCVQNEEYAFCHLSTPDGDREGYVLVVRAETGWQPVSMLRVAEDQIPAPGRKPA